MYNQAFATVIIDVYYKKSQSLLYMAGNQQLSTAKGRFGTDTDQRISNSSTEIGLTLTILKALIRTIKPLNLNAPL